MSIAQSSIYSAFLNMDRGLQSRLIGYMEALWELEASK